MNKKWTIKFVLKWIHLSLWKDILLSSFFPLLLPHPVYELHPSICGQSLRLVSVPLQWTLYKSSRRYITDLSGKVTLRTLLYPSCWHTTAAWITEISIKWMKICPLKINYTNILQAAFEVIYFCQKYTNTSFKYRKAAHNTGVQKSCW